jgi:DNA-binding Lrp family transcriptional regulator
MNYYIVYSLLKEKVDFNTGHTTEKFSTKNCSLVKSLALERVHLTRNQVLKIIIQLEKLGLIKRTETVGNYYLPFSEILPKSKAPPKAQPQAPQKPIQHKEQGETGVATLHQSRHQIEEQGTAQTPVATELQPSQNSPSVLLSVSKSIPKTQTALSEKALNEKWLEHMETVSPFLTEEEIALEKVDFYICNEVLEDSTVEPRAQPNAETEGFSENLPLKPEPANEGSKLTAFENLIKQDKMFNYPSNKISRNQYKLWEKSGITEQQVLIAIDKVKAKGVISTTPDKLTAVLEGMRKKRQMVGENANGLVL